MKLTSQSPFLMVTGLARSGTTLLAEALDHHSQVMCPPDPIVEFFRAFNHFAHLKVRGKKLRSDQPMDHFAFGAHPRVREFLEHSDLRHPIPDDMRRMMLERISRRGGVYCPEIRDKVFRCQAMTFDGLFVELLQVLADTYAKPGCRIFGFKDAWCEHLVFALARTFPAMKFVLLLRDPRAVASSNLSSSSPYPLLFNIRDWRKSVYYGWRLRRDPLLHERFHQLNYEDLVMQPAAELSKLTRFLDLPDEDSMTQAPFKNPNTSYADSSQNNRIVGGLKDTWRNRLDLTCRVRIETLAGLEMNRSDYGDFARMPAIAKFARSWLSQEIAFDKLGAWCRCEVGGRFSYAVTWRVSEYGLEMLRQIYGALGLRFSVLDDFFFYEAAYYDWLLNNGHGSNGCHGIKNSKGDLHDSSIPA